MTMDDRSTPVQYHAAMFRRLGSGVKLSRSGMSLVFERPVCGRQDLSDTVELAAAQLRESGIDPAQVTTEDLEAYQAWRSGLDYARRVGGARIRISATFGHVPVCVSPESGTPGEMIPANAVSLVDGFGEIVDEIVVPRIEHWDREATNRMSGTGAACYRLDQAGVAAAIEAIRARRPQFADAPVRDNSGEFLPR